MVVSNSRNILKWFCQSHQCYTSVWAMLLWLQSRPALEGSRRSILLDIRSRSYVDCSVLDANDLVYVM